MSYARTLSATVALLMICASMGAYAEFYTDGFSYEGIDVKVLAYVIDNEYGDITMSIESPEGGTLTVELDTASLAATNDGIFVTVDGYPSESAPRLVGSAIVLVMDIPAGTTEVNLAGIMGVSGSEQTTAATPINVAHTDVSDTHSISHTVKTVVDGHTFAFVSGNEIRIIDVTMPAVPLNVATIPITSGKLSHIQTDKAAYLAAVDTNQTLHILDVTIPYKPIPISAFQLSTHQTVVDLDWVGIDKGTFVMAAAGDAIQVVDITNPDNPEPAGTISISDWQADHHIPILNVEPFWLGDDSYVIVAGQNAVQIREFDNPAYSSIASHMSRGHYGFEIPHGIADMDVMESEGRTFAFMIGQDGVMIADVTNPANPAHVQRLVLPNLQDMDVVRTADATYALFMGAGKMYVADVTEPSRPVHLATAPIPTSGIIGMASDDRLWALSVGDTVAALDITNPRDPVPAYIQEGGISYAPEAVEVVEIDGNVYALAASTAHSTIQITDITKPDNPVQVSAIVGGQYAHGVIHGPHDIAISQMHDKTYAVVPSIYSSSVTILDITNPHKPSIVSTLRLPVLNAPTSAAVINVDDSTYVAVTGYYSAAIRMIDITNPHLPRLGVIIKDGTYGFEGLGDPLSIDAAYIGGSPHIVVANYYDGAVQIIDATNPDWPVSSAVIQDGSGLKGTGDINIAQIWGQTVMVTASSYDDGVYITDITNPRSPVPLAYVTDGQDGFENLEGVQYVDVIQHGFRTFVVATSYFDQAIQFMDITDPRSPVPLPSAVQGNDGFEALIGPTDVAALTHNGKSYVVAAAYFGNGIQIAEIIDGPALRAASAMYEGPAESLPLINTDGISTMAISDRVYALTTSSFYDAVQVTDVTDPHSPVPVSLIRDDGKDFVLGGPAGVAAGDVAGRPYAFITWLEEDAIQVVDMSNPAEPEQVGIIHEGLDSIVGAEISYINQTPYLVVGAGAGDILQFIDVSNPALPVITSETSNVIPAIHDVDVVNTPYGTWVLLASFSNNALYILDATDPASPRQMTEITGEEYLYSVTGLDAIAVGDTVLAVVASYQTDMVAVLDITDPANPVLLSSIQGNEGRLFLNSPEALRVIVIGDGIFAAIANGNDSMQLVDITDPHNPVRASTTGIIYDIITYGTTDVHAFHVDERTYIIFQTIDGNVTPIADATKPNDMVGISTIPPLYSLESLR